MPLTTLVLAAGPYDRHAALRDGTVAPDGCSLDFRPYAEPAEMFTRMHRDLAFDISEYSCSIYLTEVEKGPTPYVAIPVFPSRYFRHGFIFVNKHAGIHAPKDLEGKRVGVPTYGQTAGYWMRGMLRDDYGVRQERIAWFEGGVNAPRLAHPGDGAHPAGVSIATIPNGKTLGDMLASGELDALVTAAKPRSLHERPDAVGRLFPDYRSAERDYFRRTGIFPIMHTVVVKRAVIDAHPGIARALFDAFEASKRKCHAELRASRGALPYMLPWLEADMDEIDDVFAGDAWPNGLAANRHNLDTLQRYMVEQGALRAPVPLKRAFLDVGS
ncbi:MAG: ABC transporter substrate-binding protein [SAR202 cluster bacterium]|nr:ABC transporter substrate-binding protein [SAR202 cluster bacterium]